MKVFKRSFICILIVLFIALIHTALWAQENDTKTILFKDGTAITGVIIKMNNEIVKLKTSNEEIVTRNFDDIVDILGENEIEKLSVSKNAGEPLIAKHTWEIGPEISHIRYEEPSLNMEENGVMYGIGASYAYHNGVMLKGEIGYSYGYVDYKGTGTVDNIEDYLLEIRGLAGYDFFITESSMITPYIGFGYRQLYDNFGGTISSTGTWGYDRESKYCYIPIGIETFSDISNGWFFGITAEFDYFLEGKQTSYLSGHDPGYNDPENKQKDGYGFRGSLKFQKKGERIGYIIEPFIRYWKIDKSEIENITYNGTYLTYGWEPENKSTQIGIMFMVVF